MSMTLYNMPFFYLLWITVGIVLIVIGIFMMASHQQSDNYYTDLSKDKGHQELGELFNFFLEEEEKKNQGFRDMLVDYTQKQVEPVDRKIPEKTKDTTSDITMNEVIRLHEEGLDAQTIAKSLKRGVGEVKLIISLYTMR